MGRGEALAVGSPALQRGGEDAAGEQRALDGIRGLARHKHPLGLRHEGVEIVAGRKCRQLHRQPELASALVGQAI